MSAIRLAPSILSADFTRLGEEVRAAEEAGADWIHVDVMDGHFVPNLTMGPAVAAAIRRVTQLPIDVHLMIDNPDEFITAFADAGASTITVHQEVLPHLHRTVQRIRELGVRAGVAINPATPVETLVDILPFLDLVLVMTVNPGFGGQDYLATMEPKIAEVAAMIEVSGRDIDLEVDGGIGPATVAGAAAAGADVLVAGSALYRDPEGLEHAVAEIRALAEAARG